MDFKVWITYFSPLHYSHLKSKSFLGFVDMLDIVSFAVSLLEFNNGEIDSQLLFENSQKMLSKQVKHIVDMSKINPVCQVRDISPLLQTIGVFQKGIHRVAVIGPDGQIVNILSQSDVVRFLLSEVDNFLPVFDKTVAELNLGSSNPITIHQDELTIIALKKMHENKISALAVVDDHGLLIGNLSASDLKGAVTTDEDEGADPLGSLLLPVLSFLRQGGMSCFPVATCTKKNTFNMVLVNVVSSRVHRLWIVDEVGKPIGIISLTDIMKSLIDLKQPERKERY